MKWKNNEYKQYPTIILHDCFVESFDVIGNGVILKFTKNGFFKKDKISGTYFRTDGGELRLMGCMVEDIICSEMTVLQSNSDDFFTTIINEMNVNDFITSINSPACSFEIIEESYDKNSCFYIGELKNGNVRKKYSIQATFENLSYHWNDIQYDMPW